MQGYLVGRAAPIAATTETAAIAAVSTRRMVVVNPTGVKPAAANPAVSCSVHPPSGPMKRVNAFLGRRCIASPMGMESALVERYQPAGGSVQAIVAIRSDTEVNSPIRITPGRRDCLADSVAIRSQRSRLPFP